VVTFRPPSGSRLPTGVGAGTPVLVHAPATVIASCGSYRTRMAKSTSSSRPTSSATAANTDSGAAPLATSTATRRRAACSPIIRSSRVRPREGTITASVCGPASLKRGEMRPSPDAKVGGDLVIQALASVRCSDDDTSQPESTDPDGLSTGQRCDMHRRQGATKNDELASRHPRFAGKGDRSARWQVHPGDGTNRPPIPVKIDTVRNITLASRREGAAQRGDGVRARNAFAGHRHYELSSRQPQMAYRKFGRWRGRLNVER